MVVLGLLVAFAVPAPARAASELRLGSVAMDIPAVMNRRLAPLTGYLEQALKRPIRLQLSADMPSAIGQVATCGVDLAYLTPVAYLEAHDRGGAKLVVKTVTRGKSSFRLMIVVRSDSPLQSVGDLRGRSFAFGDRAALLQRAVVVGAGLKLEQLSEYRFLGHYDNIVRGVLNGDFDAGILKDTMAYQWEGKGIRVLYSSPELPPYNVVACGAMDDATLARVREAFLALDPDNAAHRAIIKALDPQYDGFAAAQDSDYAIVRKLIQPFSAP